MREFIEEKTKMQVYFRDQRKCVLCGENNLLEGTPHHCFWKSQYFKNDKDEAWNLVIICKKCHFEIHHKSNKDKDKKCKEIALNRYDGNYKEELIRVMKIKGFKSGPE